MKKIDRYIFSEMQLPIIFGVSLFTFIFLIDILMKMIQNIVVKSVPVGDVLAFLSFALPPILTETIPMGVFFGIMMTYSSLSRTSEIVAMQSIGMGLNRLIKPSITLGLIITAGTYVFQETIVPKSYERLFQTSKKIAYTRPTVKLEEKIFVKDIGTYSVYINKLDNKTNIAKSLILFDKQLDKRFPTVLLAKTTEWKDSKMISKDGVLYQIDNKGVKSLSGSFKTKTVPIAAFFGDFSKNSESRESMGINSLRKKINELKKNGIPYRKYEIEMYKKLYVPVSTIMLCFLGVVLSVTHSRTGKGASFGISLLIIFVYIIIQNIAKVFSQDKISPALGMMVPNLILLITCSIFYYRKIRRT